MRCSLTYTYALILLLAVSPTNAQDTTAANPMPETNKQFLLTYPNLDNPDGEVLLENEHVVLQRFVVGPGEWEGIHSHSGNQIYIHIKGGIWSERRGGEQLPPSSFSETGSVGWMEAIDMSVAHESGNTGDTTIDLVWITLK